MNKFKLCVGVLLVFAVGALAGSLGTRLYVRERIVAFTRGDPPAVRMLKRISRELDLTQSQREKIDKIVADTQAELFDFKRRYHPEFVQIVDKSIGLMKEQLNDEQKEKLDQLHERLKRRIRRRGFYRGFREDEIAAKTLLEERERLGLTQEQEAEIRRHQKKSIDNHLGAILTEKQMEAYRKMREERRKRRKR